MSVTRTGSPNRPAHRGSVLISLMQFVVLSVLCASGAASCRGTTLPDTGRDVDGHAADSSTDAAADPVEADVPPDLTDAEPSRDSGPDDPNPGDPPVDGAASADAVTDVAPTEDWTRDAPSPDIGGEDAADETELVDVDGDAFDDATADAAVDAGRSDGNPVVVLAGDSWSTGLVGPLSAEMAERGWGSVDLRWETTANAGSQARGWVRNEHPPALGGGVDSSRARMLDALDAALDAEPPADLLVLVITGNDYNRECSEGWGSRSSWLRGLALDAIAADAASLLDHALAGRPDLRVLFVGYDYLHFEFLRAFGMSLAGLDTHAYNRGLVDLGSRIRALAEARSAVVYAHGFGILQHAYGDRIHAPFSIPNPLTGYPEYPAGVAPRPGGPPAYAPFPGGFVTYPAPLDHMPDGIHPDAEGFRTLISNALDQLPSDWIPE